MSTYMEERDVAGATPGYGFDHVNRYFGITWPHWRAGIDGKADIVHLAFCHRSITA